MMQVQTLHITAPVLSSTLDPERPWTWPGMHTEVTVEEVEELFASCHPKSAVCPAFLRIRALQEQWNLFHKTREVVKQTGFQVRTNHWKQKRWFANAGTFTGSGDTEFEALNNLLVLHKLMQKEESM